MTAGFDRTNGVVTAFVRNADVEVRV